MTPAFDPTRDLSLTRLIRAPRRLVWKAWTDPDSFARWWVPHPAEARIDAMELEPGGAFRTSIREDGGPFRPHIDGCLLAVEPERRIVFTTALTGGWRPAEQPFITAHITFGEHPEGTAYAAHVMHKNPDDRAMHEDLGFQDGWGTVTEQLARLVE
ncbi:activator of HSP90 ATPase [Allostella sp. ATCC 35155]|nr:activator of HSP90 ATPase [Stella sp. ATCC 35155]